MPVAMVGCCCWHGLHLVSLLIQRHNRLLVDRSFPLISIVILDSIVAAIAAVSGVICVVFLSWTDFVVVPIILYSAEDDRRVYVGTIGPNRYKQSTDKKNKKIVSGRYTRSQCFQGQSHVM